MRPLAVLIALFIALGGGYSVWSNSRAGTTIPLPPVASGDVLAGHSTRRPLTEEQLNAVSHWLAAHVSGWQAVVVTAPAPAVVIELRHLDGTTTKLYIYKSP